MKRIANIILCLTIFSVVRAELVPSNVVIADANEVYTFIEGGDFLEVKTTEQAVYEATRKAATVVPHVFYCDVISLDKVSGGKAQYKSINSPNVFHDDSKICFFEAELKSKGAKSKAEFRRTFKDAAYFTKICLADIYPIRQKTVKFEIPGTRPDIELIDLNMPDSLIVRSEIVNPDRSRTITYSINRLPALRDESSAPPSLTREPYVLIKGYLDGLDGLYEFHRSRLDVDTVIPGVDAIISDVCGGSTSRDDIVNNIYKYVQEKIRYVAYEEGEAGFRPDAPAEVLRKGYGDCKGMSLLLATLLNRAGVEAYVASVGTDDVPFKISEFPILGSTDHMICIAPAEGDTLIIDATHEYISSRDIPAWIQGKDAMMYTDKGYQMIDIPVRGSEYAREESVYEYEITDGRLEGQGTMRFTGDNLEMFLSVVNDVNRTYKSDVLAMQIKPRPKVKVETSSVKADFVKPGVFELSANISDDNAVTDTGEAIYVDLSVAPETFVKRVNPTGRRSDYQLPFRTAKIRRSTVKIPDGYDVGELPEDFHAECEGVKFDCVFVKGEDGKVAMTKSFDVEQTLIPCRSLDNWNRTLAAWNEASMHQVELIKK